MFSSLINFVVTAVIMALLTSRHPLQEPQVHTTITTKFPEYQTAEHPIFNVLGYKESFGASPAPVRAFYAIYNNRQRINNFWYEPRSTTFINLRSRQIWAHKLDALLVPAYKLDISNKMRYLNVVTNGKPRLFVVLSTPELTYRKLNGSLRVHFPGVTGYVDKRLATAVQVNETWDDRRWYGAFRQLRLPFNGVAVPVVAKSASIWFPHPSEVRVNGVPVHRYTLLFAQNGKRSDVITPFREPAVPNPFRAFVGDSSDNRPLVYPGNHIPVPNRRCPQWLHDLYVVQSKSGQSEREETGEPSYWRTWHPTIDPIYWCSFGHEHGSYPGRYRPMFEYTAWKKEDFSSTTGRQQESHQGFKIFSFAVPRKGSERNRAVVITVHQHLSNPRRFHARTHTVVFAVLDMDRDWYVEAELHFKMDFGPAQVTYSNGRTVPLSFRDDQAEQEMQRAGFNAGRRFTVLNLTDYPSSVDRDFQLKPSWTDLRTLSEGIYEQWKGSLGTCSMSDSEINYGFLFETRDPATALRGTQSYEMERLRGSSANRLLVLRRPLYIRRNKCHFHGKVKETFYSDVDLKEIRPGYGQYVVRQFMKADFEDLSLPAGRYEYLGGSFTPAMRYSKDGKGRILTVDGSVDGTEN